MTARKKPEPTLAVQSATLREVTAGTSEFPPEIRRVLCEAVGSIGQDELESLLAVNEADPANLDGRIEAEIRRLTPSLSVAANRPVSPATRFHSDLIIESGDDVVCVEIEKSQLARFELDVLKMQVFAAQITKARPNARCFGAFIVPRDNVVARHITGNSGESSYAYLLRLCRLVAEITPSPLRDILVVGYGTHEPEEKPKRRRTSGGRGKSVLQAAEALLPDEVVAEGLQGYPTRLVLDLRRRLIAEHPDLHEKFNARGRYLGYARKGTSDSAYVYVQKRQLVLDLRLSAERADEVRRNGLEVKPRNNFQGKNGWLTGVRVPHDTDRADLALQLILDALRGG